MSQAVNERATYLSKSLFIRGLKCHKALYLKKFRPELQDEISEQLQQRFDAGHDVGSFAQKLFPGGVEVPYEGLSHQEQLDMTQSLIQQGLDTIYEASFFHNDVFVKVDILHKGNDGWELYEVKASTSVKDYHVDDISVQYYVVSGSGIPLSQAYLVHINNQYIRQGDIEPAELFTKVDLTETVNANESFIIEELGKQRTMLSSGEPVIDIGPYCDEPFECDFKGHCWAHIPNDSIFDIRGRMDRRFDLYEKGILIMYDVPQKYLSLDQFIQISTKRENTTYYDHAAVKQFTNSLWYPLYFLDFETFYPAIPLFDGIRPYEQVPFQYSLHYSEHKEAELKHHEYLAMPNIDPREELIRKLLSEIPEDACILAYNKTFEIRILNGLASW